MANIKELRGRIKSIANIAKITKAMEMVASMKLRKVQQRALAAGPFARALRRIMGHLAEYVGDDAELPLFVTRPVKSVGVLLITSDRGLCGAYNANVLNRLHRYEEELARTHPGAKIKLYVYGRRGFNYLRRRGYEVVRYYVDPPLDALDFNAARLVAKELVDEFLKGELDEVRAIATAFISAGRFEPLVGSVLPITGEVAIPLVEMPGMAEEPEPESRYKHDYLLEPDPDTLFREIVPRYLEVSIFFAMLSSYTAEMAARRMAMKGATDAASRMGKDLRKTFNRARQENITKELLDIVGGTNAVS